jgi:hypothetical protein
LIKYLNNFGLSRFCPKLKLKIFKNISEGNFTLFLSKSLKVSKKSEAFELIKGLKIELIISSEIF